MKKFLLLLCALLGSVGTWADVNVTFVDGVNAPYDTYGTRNTGVSPQTFTSKESSGFAGIVLSAPILDRATWWSTYCLAIKNTAVHTDENVVITAPTGYAIKSISMTLQAISSSNPYDVTVNGSTTRITGAAAKDYNCTVNDKSFSFTINSTSESVNWLAVRAMTLTIIPEVTSYDVNYIVKLNGATQIGSTSVKEIENSEPSLPENLKNSIFNYTYYSDASCTNSISQITEACTIYAKATFTNEAFVDYATSVDDANAQWYTMTLRERSFYTNNNAIAVSTSEIVSEAAQWVFIGNAYGAQVYNKGAQKYLVMDNGNPALSETASTTWLVAPHSTGTGFMLYNTSDYRFMYVNSSGNLANSTNGGFFTENSSSARFVATEVAADYHESIVENVQPFFTTGVGSLFGLKSSVYDTYNARVTAAATSCSSDEYADLLAVVANTANYVYPTSGYYRIKNYGGGYFGQTSASSYAGNLTNTDAASIVYLTQSGEEGSYTYTIQVQGNDYVDQTGTVTLSIAAPGYCYMNDRTSNTVFGYACANGGNVYYNSIASAGNTAKWSLEEAEDFTVAISDAGYATFCVPFAVTIPSGVKAYAVESITNKVLDFYTFDAKIPAGVPVILEGNADTYTFNITSADSYEGANKLVGNYTESTAPVNSYVLQKQGEDVGFYQVVGEAKAISANRAYLSVPSNVKAFFLGSDTDAIKSVFSGIAEGKIFDLSGRKVAKMQKGNTYIVNGKKVNVK